MDKEQPAPAPCSGLFLLAAVLAACSGCASNTRPSETNHTNLLGKALRAVGLQKTGAEAGAHVRTIPIQLVSAPSLNSGNDGQPMALVVRVYRLKRIERFEQAPFQAFLDEASERAALGEDLVGVTELVLQPGQRHEVIERLPPEANMLGVVGLFRAPALRRWRLSFDGSKSLKERLTVGLHACALTTSNSIALLSQVDGDPHSLATARCTR